MSGGRGFTLLETALAASVGGLVIVGATVLFGAVSRSEATLNEVSRATHETALTQQALRRALTSLVMLARSDVPTEADREAQAQLVDESLLEPLPRPRMELGFDLTPMLDAMVDLAGAEGVEIKSPYDGDRIAPQRLEVVVSQPPLSTALSRSAAWLANDGAARLALYAEPPPPTGEGGVRGCFELRPDGMRERVIAGTWPRPVPWEAGLSGGAGVASASLGGVGVGGGLGGGGSAKGGWTLWWRPVSEEENEARELGLAFDVDSRPDLLQEATPLIRGLYGVQWSVFENDPEDRERLVSRRETAALTSDDIPGYVELKLSGGAGLRAEWVFEVDWSVALAEGQAGITLTPGLAGTLGLTRGELEQLGLRPPGAGPGETGGSASAGGAGATPATGTPGGVSPEDDGGLIEAPAVTPRGRRGRGGSAGGQGNR